MGRPDGVATLHGARVGWYAHPHAIVCPGSTEIDQRARTVALVTAFRVSGEELHQGRTCSNDQPLEYIWCKLPRRFIEGHIHGNGWKWVGLPRRHNEWASNALDLFFLGQACPAIELERTQAQLYSVSR